MEKTPLLLPIARGKRALITAFILITAAAAGASSWRPLPSHNPVTRGLLFYANWLRIFQRWELFVPEPRRKANQYRVDMEFRDGTKATWRRTQPTNWDFFQRHEAYNFQKWDLAGHHLDQPSQLWNDLAAYLIRRYDTNPRNPMVTLKLIREEADWPPPRESGWVGGDVTDLKWTDRTVFTYYALQKMVVH